MQESKNHPEKRRLMRLSPDFIVQALGLPFGTKIVDAVMCDHDYNAAIEVVIENDDFPDVDPNLPLPEVQPQFVQYTRTFMRFESWYL